MRFINLNWSYTKGEGAVKYTEAFDDADQITKLDFLKDCLYDLTNKYNSLLTKTDKRTQKELVNTENSCN